MYWKENDGLPLEYKLKYGTAYGHLRLSDIVEDPTILRKLGILDSSLKEKLFNLRVIGESRPTFDDFPNFGLIVP